MKKPVVLVLVFVLLVGTIGVVFAGPPARIPICHIDEDGVYHLISIPQPAVDARLAKGDVKPGENGLDENCEPVQYQYPGGCTNIGNNLGIFPGFNSSYVVLLGGTAVEDIGLRQAFYDSDCTLNYGDNVPRYYEVGMSIIWASGWSEASALCSGTAGEAPTPGTPPPYLYVCDASS